VGPQWYAVTGLANVDADLIARRSAERDSWNDLATALPPSLPLTRTPTPPHPISTPPPPPSATERALLWALMWALLWALLRALLRALLWACAGATLIRRVYK
jgi:hypothetical protein